MQGMHADLLPLVAFPATTADFFALAQFVATHHLRPATADGLFRKQGNTNDYHPHPRCLGGRRGVHERRRSQRGDLLIDQV
jgi:hypothetical protein